MDRTPHSTLSVPHYNQRHTAARLWHTIIWHTILTHCRLWTKREEKRSSTSTNLLFRSPGFLLASSNCTVTSHFSQVSHCPHNEIGPKSYDSHYSVKLVKEQHRFVRIGNVSRCSIPHPHPLKFENYWTFFVSVSGTTSVSNLPSHLVFRRALCFVLCYLIFCFPENVFMCTQDF